MSLTLANMYTIKSNQLTVTIAAKGAELQSIVHNTHQLEYLWSGDAAYWAKKSPVLFPIVGTLKDNQYTYNGKNYSLSRHGFARDKTFEVTAQSADSITFTLTDSAETKNIYPFAFALHIIYTVQQDELTVTYKVENKNAEDMYFSIGGHPAFKVPLVKNTGYSDYVLHFNKMETAGRWPISNNGLLQDSSKPCLQHTGILPLSKTLFQQDALVFKHLQSDAVQLQSDKTPHGFMFTFAGFPYLGIWAAPNADFVCIEPWCGIADIVNSNGQLTEKEGIQTLAPNTTFERSWKVWFY